MAASALPPAWQHAPILDGRHVHLEPLSMEHVDGLAAARDDAALDDLWFTHLPERDGVAAYVESALRMQADAQALPFAVRDADGVVVGSTRYYGLDAPVPKLLIGYTWYTPRVQRSGLNTEAKLLLLAHAFEAMGCISVGFETSSHNTRSRAAIARLGAKQDGILRNHKRHADGSPRDTVAFSIIDSEWSQVKRNLQDKLQAHQEQANG
ncbi:GNAT family N-acetyltransferase [Pseudoxanthomonas kalamensis DSM 18571]|uniref:GNAT family N-acetyltransferase n=1 Tax=Pseudoxanthomonas kalamensis TaxID=289483 RepID=UPI0013911799|nr:GNAT family protein [Pseudoxanthomonas kalamensis]KAF1710445.1 GNAT family N-acetyltransferase [Pseudoxanthomonas kalamensis DSM 18571]